MEKEMFKFWWDYYLKCNFNESEKNEFCRLIDKYDSDTCINIIAFTHIFYDATPKVILKAIRENKVEEFLNNMHESILKFEKDAGEVFELYKLEIIGQIKHNYIMCS